MKMLRAVNILKVNGSLMLLVETEFLKTFVNRLEELGFSAKFGVERLSDNWGDALEDEDVEVCSYLSKLGIIYSDDSFRVAMSGGVDLKILMGQRDALLTTASNMGLEPDLLAFQPTGVELLD